MHNVDIWGWIMTYSPIIEESMGRMPTEAEQVTAIDGLDRLTAVEDVEAAATTGAAPTAAAAGNGQVSPQWLATPHDRARSAFIHVLLNHNDFVTIR